VARIALWCRNIANILVTTAHAAAESQQKTNNEDYQAAKDGRAEVKPDDGCLLHRLLRLAKRVNQLNCAILGRFLSR
jgi:hypothetical protein